MAKGRELVTDVAHQPDPGRVPVAHTTPEHVEEDLVQMQDVVDVRIPRKVLATIRLDLRSAELPRIPLPRLRYADTTEAE